MRRRKSNLSYIPLSARSLLFSARTAVVHGGLSPTTSFHLQGGGGYCRRLLAATAFNKHSLVGSGSIRPDMIVLYISVRTNASTPDGSLDVNVAFGTNRRLLRPFVHPGTGIALLVSSFLPVLVVRPPRLGRTGAAVCQFRTDWFEKRERGRMSMPGMQATWWPASLDAGSPIDDAGGLSTAGAGSGVLGSWKEWHCRDHEAALSSTLSAAQRLVVVATLRWITNACGYGAADVWVGASPQW